MKTNSKKIDQRISSIFFLLSAKNMWCTFFSSGYLLTVTRYVTFQLKWSRDALTKIFSVENEYYVLWFKFYFIFFY